MAIFIWNGSDDDDVYTPPIDIGGNYESFELHAGGGDDSVTAAAGDDAVIHGGTGNDTLTGANFGNRLFGEDGDDVLDARFGSSTTQLDGGAGNDFLVGRTGGPLGSTLDGGAGNDTLVGGSGADVYFVDSAADIVVETYVRVTGDPPNPLDTVRATASVTLAANVESLFLLGTDALAGTGNGGANQMFGNVAANTLAGGNGDDSLFGGDGDDQLAGGKGNDLLSGDTGADTAAGGAGSDRIRVNSAADVVVELLNEGSDTVESAVSYTLADGTHVEVLQLTGTAAVTATGNAFGNTLAGNSGNNTLDGAGGFDSASYAGATAGVRIDLVAGTATGQGSDTLLSIERVFGSAFADSMLGSAGADILNGGAGADTLRGGTGGDTYVVDHLADLVAELTTDPAEIDRVEALISWTLNGNVEHLQLLGSAANGTGNTLANDILGNAAANALLGGDGNDTLTGDAGNDTLTGGTGADLLVGGAGADRYGVDSLADTITETTTAAEIDTVAASLNWTLGANLENLELAGNARVGTGNALANRIFGGSGNDTLDGGLGADSLSGGDGNDVYLVNSALDVCSETFLDSGTDEVRSTASYTLGSGQLERLVLLGTAGLSGNGNDWNNTITGNSGNNSLGGAGGNDALAGGDGNDTLRGGSGSDTLAGGAGADIVQLDSTSGSDTVTGFVSGTDDLRVSMGTATRIGDGDTQVEFAATRATAGGFSTAAELVVFSSNIVGTITTAAAAAKIGAATAAYAVGSQRLFVVDNGASSAVFRFVAADADAQVETSELTLLATLSGTASTSTGDYLFGG